MVRIGDNDRAVVEFHLVARPAVHDVGRRDYTRRPAVSSDQVVTDSDLTHGRPAGWCRQRGIKREGLAGPGSRCYHYHLAWVEAVGQAVQVDKAGGDAGKVVAAAADRLDLIEGAGHDLGQRVVILARPALGDGVHLGLGPVHELVGLGVARVAELDDPGPGLDQAAQDRALADDAGVVFRVRRRRRGEPG